MSYKELTKRKCYYEQIIKEAQEQLSTTDPEIYGEYWRNRMQQAQQQIWAIDKQIERLRQIILVKISLEFTWNLNTFDHPIASENY